MTSILLALYLAAVPTVTVTGRVLAPNGAAPKSGTVTCRLTTSGAASDGGVLQEVAGEVTATLGAGGAISMPLVPNDSMTPAGTRYTCTYAVVLANGRHYQWARQWQLASSPATQDVGSVPVPTYPLGAAMPAAAPTFSPASGSTISATTAVTITANTPGSVIYYTTDGSTPTTSSSIYLAPFIIPAAHYDVASGVATVKAIAAPVLGWVLSSVTTAAFTRDGFFPFSAAGCTSQVPNAIFVRGTSRSCGVDTCTASQACLTANGASLEQADNDVSSPSAIGPALWATAQVGSVLPTLTANTSVCPDGLTTGDRLAFGATGSTGQYSIVSQQRYNGTSGLAWTFDVDLKAVGSSGTVALAITDGTASAGQASACAVNTSTFSRCSVTYTPGAAATQYLAIGTYALAWTGLPAVQPSVTVEACNARLNRTPVALALRPDAQAGDVIIYPKAMSQSGSGSVLVTPEWAAAAALVDRVVFDNGGVSLKYLAATSRWRLTAGGQTTDSLAQAFGAGAPVAISWTYTQGAKACLTVAGYESCSVGNVSSFTPWAVTFVGGSDIGGGDLALKDLRFNATEAYAPAVTARTVFALGDSITFGSGVATAYPSTLDTQLAGDWVVTNGGVANDLLEQMHGRLRSTGYGKEYVVLLGGVNNLIQGRKGTDAWLRTRSIAEEARAAGMKVILVTVLPFKSYVHWTAEREAGRVELNGLITAYCATGAATCVDAATDFDDGTQTMKAAYRQADFLHPNQTGADRLATLVRGALP